MEGYSIALGFVIGVIVTIAVVAYVHWDNRYQGVHVKVKVIERKEDTP